MECQLLGLWQLFLIPWNHLQPINLKFLTCFYQIDHLAINFFHKPFMIYMLVGDFYKVLPYLMVPSLMYLLFGHLLALDFHKILLIFSKFLLAGILFILAVESKSHFLVLIMFIFTGSSIFVLVWVSLDHLSHQILFTVSFSLVNFLENHLHFRSRLLCCQVYILLF